MEIFAGVDLPRKRTNAQATEASFKLGKTNGN
jgi:hypothetical protein